MNSASWRVLLLTLCAIVAVSAGSDIFMHYGTDASPSFVGLWGNTVGASSQPYHLVVRSIDPRHASDLAGLRPGDLIDIRANTAVERFWLFGQPISGHP